MKAVAQFDDAIEPGRLGPLFEVFNALGDTIAVTAVPESALEPLREDEILCARVMTAV